MSSPLVSALMAASLCSVGRCGSTGRCGPLATRAERSKVAAAMAHSTVAPGSFIASSLMDSSSRDDAAALPCAQRFRWRRIQLEESRGPVGQGAKRTNGNGESASRLPLEARVATALQSRRRRRSARVRAPLRSQSDRVAPLAQLVTHSAGQSFNQPAVLLSLSLSELSADILTAAQPTSLRL